ncbi:MAG: radical SAM protein [bacterium]
MIESRKIKLGVECNNSCVFCAALKEGYHRDFEGVAADLQRARAENRLPVVLTGLEPTVFPGILDVIEFARDLHFDGIAMDTNARMFRNTDFASRCARLGLTGARVLFPHFNAAGYAEIAGAPDGFAQAAAGVKNLKDLGTVEIAARIPICAGNYKSLAAILKYARSLGINEARAYFPRGYMFGGEEFDGAAFEEQLGQAVAFAARAGMQFECDRESSAYHCLAEMDERTAACFYPTVYVGRNKHPETLEALIRPTFACNQICKFCWVDTSAPKPPRERIESELRYVIRNKIPRLAFSGGEPTLDPRLADYIETAKRGGVRQTELHTNAVRLSNRDLCARLKTAGLDIAYCTLLAPDAKTSDSITRTEGSFRKTVAGIINMIDCGVNVVIHTVIMGDNYRLMPQLAVFVDEHFAYRGAKPPINYSYAAPRDAEAMSAGVVPRFADAIPYLEEALAECGARRIPFSAGEGLKGAPPCVIPFREKYLTRYRAPAKNAAGGAFVKNKSCLSCKYDDTCFGVRRHYADYYGLKEIKPVKAAGARKLKKTPAECCE